MAISTNNATNGLWGKNYRDITDEASSWVDVHCWHEGILKIQNDDVWIYRAQSDATWPLETSIERAVDKYYGNLQKARECEESLIIEFRRKAHLYIRNFPEKKDILEWLTIMQHFGCPTRLLDFTYSFFVACFLAVDEMEYGKEEKAKCAIFAINASWLVERLQGIYRGIKWKRIDSYLRGNHFRNIFLRQPRPMVVPVNSFQLNERLVNQRGTFLCPGDITKPFSENLARLFDRPKDSRRVFRKLVIKLNRDGRAKVIHRLHDMVISRASLFPGLDGFAKSLPTIMAVRGLTKKKQPETRRLEGFK